MKRADVEVKTSPWNDQTEGSTSAEDEIRRLDAEFSVRRGWVDGQGGDDWLKAEAVLRDRDTRH